MAQIQQIVVGVRMSDGTEYPEVRTTVADRMRYANVRIKQKWPSMTDDADRAMTFLAYAALARTGEFAGTFTEFVDQAEAVEALEAGEVNPI